LSSGAARPRTPSWQTARVQREHLHPTTQQRLEARLPVQSKVGFFYHPPVEAKERGWAGSANSWNGISQAFDPRKFRAIAYDFRGHGNSEKTTALEA